MQREFLQDALTMIPERGPRTEAERCGYWRGMIREDLELEDLLVKVQDNQDYLFATWFERGLYGKDELKKQLSDRTTGMGALFTCMHHAAYFDGLVGGTGLSKDVTQSQPQPYHLE